MDELIVSLPTTSTSWTRFEMDSCLDRIEAQRSTDVSHDQRRRRGYFPMNLINKGVHILRLLGFSQSGGDGATPPTGDTKSVREFLTDLRLSDLYDVPGESVAMNPEIYSAMRYGNKKFLEKMRSDETPMACFKNDNGDSILHLAAASGHLELVKRIVSECPSLLLEPNWDDQIPLHVAAHAGHTAVVKALVASVTWFSAQLPEEDRERLNLYVLKDINGDTALHLVLKDLHGKKQHRPRLLSISRLIMHIRSSSFPDISTRITETAACLVNANQRVLFIANEDEISPLYLAVEAGNVSLVNAMLNLAGNNVQQHIISNLASQLEGRKSLVHAALKAKNTDVLDVILDEDPSLVNERDEKGRTCLSVGASVGFYEGICRLLARSTEAVYVKDENGYFPIHMAAKYGHVQILKEILKRCPAALELLGKHGRNILHVAAKNGQVNAIKFILRLYKDRNKEKSINEKDADGNTLLHLATENAHPKVVSMLTWDDRVNVEALNRDDLTALDIAMENLESSYRMLDVLTWIPLVSAGAPRGSELLPSPNVVGGGYKELVNTLLLVSTLVATMTFTAGFALPGGYNGSVPNLGMAALTKKVAFQVFLVFDTLAMYSSIITTVALIWAQVGDDSLIKKAFKLALPLLGVSLTFMSIAFMAGTFAAVSHLPLLAYSILGMGLIFLVVFLLILIPYVSPKFSTNPFLRYIFYFPYFLLLWVAGDNRDNE